MHISKLSLLQFKNYQSVKFLFTHKITCFTGLNGAGKTNLLDALYYLAFTKSNFNHQDNLAIAFNADFFSIDAEISENGLTKTIKINQPANGKKQLIFNNNPVKKFSDYIGAIPLIFIAPGDITLPSADAEERRKFVDSFIALYNYQFLNCLINYNKALTQRNKLLKDFADNFYFNQELLQVYNNQLVQNGQYIYTCRKNFIEQIIPLFINHYRQISSGTEEICIVYQSALHNFLYNALLEDSLQSDLQASRTCAGIHKDDFLFTINNHPLKKFGSQGQQKSFMIALKLAMFDMLKQQSGKTPVMLLDDIFEKLDEIRINKLLNLITGNYFGQIFITHTRADNLQHLFKPIAGDVSYYEIENGMIKNNL